jgi:hypothetical protein
MKFRRIGLVGCVRTKAADPAPAGDLYVSPLFVGRRKYVQLSCDEWWILSAKFGLVHPLEVVAPYDVALKDLGRAERRAWSAGVLVAIDKRIKPTGGETFEFHAGAEYRDFGLATGLIARGCRLDNPTLGMLIGEQLHFYLNAPEH